MDAGDAQDDRQSRLLSFDLNPRRLLPRQTTVSMQTCMQACRESYDVTEIPSGQLIHQKMWPKETYPMHFLTLEFDDSSVEAKFLQDMTRRTKRWVSYGIFISVGFNVSVLCIKFTLPRQTRAPLSYTCGDPALSAFLYLAQSAQMCCDRQFVLRNFQEVLLSWSMVHATVKLIVAYGIIASEIEGTEYDEVIAFEVFVILLVYRMRFLYFLVLNLFMFLGYCGLVPSFVELRHLCLMCVGLSFLSYTIELLQRKDFVQASISWGESQRSDLLLHNILPRPVIKQLKQARGQHAIAQSFADVTVLFADVVSFTIMSSQVSPPVLLDLLNSMFNIIDCLAEAHGIEKIKTIGDCYMAAAGLPLPNPHHAQMMARFGLEMLRSISAGHLRNPATQESIKVRVGIHSGPCVAGVIGHRKFAYDVWGDSVNTAARMESHGEAMRLHCSDATYDLLKGDFMCEARERIVVKGKGEMQTYFVLRERQRPDGPP